MFTPAATQFQQRAGHRLLDWATRGRNRKGVITRVIPEPLWAEDLLALYDW